MELCADNQLMYARSNRWHVAAPKPRDSRLPAAGKAQARSRLSNGKEVLPRMDGRSLVARRYRDIMCASDQGGAEMTQRSAAPTHSAVKRRLYARRARAV